MRTSSEVLNSRTILITTEYGLSQAEKKTCLMAFLCLIHNKKQNLKASTIYVAVPSEIQGTLNIIFSNKNIKELEKSKNADFEAEKYHISDLYNILLLSFLDKITD